MNKTLAGLAALLMAGSMALTGCSGGNNATPAAPGGEALDANTSATLTVAYWDKEQTPTIDANIEAFNQKYPNFKVTTSVTGWEQYWTKLRTGAEGENLPDVFWMNGPNVQLYAANEQLAPLADNTVDWNQYPKALVDLYSLDGKHYGVPKDFDTVAMWYNKDLFKEAGVDLPTDQWTWDDFNKAAREISSKLKAKKVYGVAADLDGQQSYYDTIYQAGGYVIKDGKSGYDNADTQRGLQLWADLIKDGAMPQVKVMAETLPQDMFINGKAAMYWAARGTPRC